MGGSKVQKTTSTDSTGSATQKDKSESDESLTFSDSKFDKFQKLAKLGKLEKMKPKNPGASPNNGGATDKKNGEAEDGVVSREDTPDMVDEEESEEHMEPSPVKLPAPPSKGIIKKYPSLRSRHVHFDYTGGESPPPEGTLNPSPSPSPSPSLSLPAPPSVEKKMSDDHLATSPSGILGHNNNELKVKKLELQDLNNNEDYAALKQTLSSGIEFYHWYSGLCAKKGVPPCEQLLNQIKEATSHFERVKYIDLMGVHFDKKTAEIVGEVVVNDTSLMQINLEYTDLSDELFKSILDRMLFHNKIQWLNIAHNKSLTSESFIHLSHFLDQSHLRYLDLSGIHFDKKSAELLASSLAKPSSLAILRLNECGLASGLFTGSFTVLAKGIQKSHLIKLSLRHNQLHSFAGKDIAGIIAKCTSLLRLDLRNNELKSGAHDIGEALAETKSLCELLLWDNMITAKFLTHFSHGLKKNTSLKWVDLSENPLFAVPNKILVAFKESLISHPNLIVLSMAATGMNPHGAEMLAEVLQKNQLIRRIDIGYNPIGTAGLWALEAVVKNNTTLLSFEVQIQEEDKVQQDLLQDIIESCAKNRQQYLAIKGELPREVLHSEDNVLGRENTITKPVPITEDTISPPPEAEIVEIDFEALERAIELENQQKAVQAMVDELKTKLPKAKEQAGLILQLIKNSISEDGESSVTSDLAQSLKTYNKKFHVAIPKVPETPFLASLIDVNETVCDSLDNYNEHLKKFNKSKLLEVLRSPRAKPVFAPVEEKPDSPVAAEASKRPEIDPEEWTPRTRNTVASIAADFGMFLVKHSDSSSNLLLTEGHQNLNRQNSAENPLNANTDPTNQNSNPTTPAPSTEKSTILLKNVFAANGSQKLDEKDLKKIEQKIRDESKGFELLEVSFQESELKKNENVKTLSDHFQNLEIGNRKITSELTSEAEVAKNYQGMKPFKSESSSQF